MGDKADRHEARPVESIRRSVDVLECHEVAKPQLLTQPGDVIVVTTDMEPETERLMRGDWIQATVVSQPVTMAKLAVQRVIEAAEGSKIPAETLTQASVITKRTLDTVDLSGQECE